jgi:uncharacterized protein YndB with AHSA1/START domain
MPSSENPATREVTITRRFDAPAHLLFEAYSKPEHIKRWFGPRGWPVTRADMDFRVGGAFEFAMTGPEGEAGTPFGGEYLEIVPHRRIVYDNGFKIPGAEKMIVTVTFEEADGATLLTIHTQFPSDEMYAIHVGGGIVVGIESGLDQMEELVAEMQA